MCCFVIKKVCKHKEMERSTRNTLLFFFLRKHLLWWQFSIQVLSNSGGKSIFVRKWSCNTLLKSASTRHQCNSELNCSFIINKGKIVVLPPSMQ